MSAHCSQVCKKTGSAALPVTLLTIFFPSGYMYVGAVCMSGTQACVCGGPISGPGAGLAPSNPTVSTPPHSTEVAGEVQPCLTFYVRSWDLN